MFFGNCRTSRLDTPELHLRGRIEGYLIQCVPVMHLQNHWNGSKPLIQQWPQSPFMNHWSMIEKRFWLVSPYLVTDAVFLYFHTWATADFWFIHWMIQGRPKVVDWEVGARDLKIRNFAGANPTFLFRLEYHDKVVMLRCLGTRIKHHYHTEHSTQVCTQCTALASVGVTVRARQWFFSAATFAPARVQYLPSWNVVNAFRWAYWDRAL